MYIYGIILDLCIWALSSAANATHQFHIFVAYSEMAVLLLESALEIKKIICWFFNYNDVSITLVKKIKNKY
jgi:hypothetical protein